MLGLEELKNITICPRSQKLLRQLLNENPRLEAIIKKSTSVDACVTGLRAWALETIKDRPQAVAYQKGDASGRSIFEALTWQDYAAIRILDYGDHSGRLLEDLNLHGKLVVNHPIALLWYAATQGTGGATSAFFEDMIHLFRQFTGKSSQILPSPEKAAEWMNRYPTGIDPEIIDIRKKNRDRILSIIIRKLSDGEIKSEKYTFTPNASAEEKYQTALSWWKHKDFHLRFAIRSADMLNEMLGYSLDPESMNILHDAEAAGIPFFVNPYYLSLLNVQVPKFAVGADLAIRIYLLYSRKLVDEFGKISAWEKEDIVEPGKPNAAGWTLPAHNIHRRYPDVAILIPDTTGRACGGLCSSCQRMYGFQDGEFNFDLEKLKPQQGWPEKLATLMAYFENDSQLRDILITGGDALMSSDKSLKHMLDAIYDMALAKKKANEARADGEKYAEMLRIRLGTRLPVYLPQRITKELVQILADFKARASEIGIKQFVIQTHFESPMEITPESRAAVADLSQAGWTVTNQLVFTSAAARRGHTAKLRQVLNEIGVLPYYTFTCKGYRENSFNFAPNARSVQEEIEEKRIGLVPPEYRDMIRAFPLNAEDMIANVEKLRNETHLPFLATDRNVLNLPGVGKSMTFRVIGLTYDGRRILEFDHDATRAHSPIIEKMGRIIIIESKSIQEFLDQLEDMGEDASEYETIYGYSIGETEPRMPIYEYPAYDFRITDHLTNLKIED
jgi:lysine 2,3-aminomutase